MWIRSYKCGNCKNSFKLGPGFLGFKPCPTSLECNKCNSQVNVSFSYKYTYYFNYVWKILFFLSFLICIPFLLSKDKPYEVLIVFWIGSSLFSGIFVSFLVSYFIALPVAIIDIFIRRIRKKPQKKS